MKMRIATSVLLATLMLLCAGLGAVLVLNEPRSERETLFLACFSGDNPVFAGQVQEVPKISGGWLSFHSVEHNSTVEVLNSACVLYRTAP